MRALRADLGHAEDHTKLLTQGHHAHEEAIGELFLKLAEADAKVAMAEALLPSPAQGPSSGKDSSHHLHPRDLLHDAVQDALDGRARREAALSSVLKAMSKAHEAA